MTETSGAMQVDTALVRQLAEMLDETKLTEIEVQDGERKIRVVRKPAQVAAAAPYSLPSSPAAMTGAASASASSFAATSEESSAPAGLMVRSPMVGTVYLAPEPGAKPFVSLGDTVAEGATLVIIEAMKVMNPIAAPRAGKIVQISIGDKQPVEYDQPLVIIQ